MPDKPETAACPCCGTIISPARAAIGAHPSTEEAADEAKPQQLDLYNRIYGLRHELFGAMAVIDVAQASIDTDYNRCLSRCLGDAYKRFDAIASELEVIAMDARKIEREASHG